MFSGLSSADGNDRTGAAQAGVNSAQAKMVLPVVDVVSDDKTFVLKVPELQKNGLSPNGSALSNDAAESQESGHIRNRANDLYSFGATHQPTLSRPASAIQMQVPVGMTPVHPGWQQAMSERVMWAANQQVQSATIQLDPPELGSLQVKLHIVHDQVTVSFTSPHANVRDAVEQSIPRLREMMAEQGLNLGESLVNDQSSDQERQQREFFAEKGYESLSEQNVEVQENSNVGLSLVDYYA